MPLYIAKSGDLEGCHAGLTDRLTTLKDRATQLLIKYKSGALVTQKHLPAGSTHCLCPQQHSSGKKRGQEEDGESPVIPIYRQK